MKHALIVLGSLFLSGCASTLNKGNASITINSEPTGAVVSLNGREQGTTPLLYTYNPDDGDELKFDVQHPGYKISTLTFRPQMANGVLFVDALLFQIPYIVDRNSPDLFKIPVHEHTVVLHKEVPADRTHYSMPVTGIEVGFTDRDIQGDLKGVPLRAIKEGPARELRYPEQLTSSIVSGLKGTWMDAVTARPGTQKGDETLRRSKVHLKAKLLSMKADLTGDQVRCNGPVELAVEWRIYSGLKTDSLLYTFTSTVTYHALQSRLSEVIGETIKLGATQLAEREELPDLIAALYGSGISVSKGSTVLLSKPEPIAFNGRKEMLSALVKAVVTISDDDGHGSGFLISNDGYIITNQHVVDDNSLMKVKFEQGFTLDAQVVKVNKDFDLALLKVSATDLPALQIGDDKALMLGEELFAIGTPMDASLGQSVSRGILSGRREYHEHQYIQTDVSINPGNSGGPMIDETGKVVGVATMKISGDGVEGLGFAVPISVAIEMLNITLQ